MAFPPFYSDGARRYARSSPDLPEEGRRVFGLSPEADAPTPQGASGATLPALSGMTKADLEKTAEAEGVDLSAAKNNAERRAAIEAARGRSAGGASGGSASGENA